MGVHPPVVYGLLFVTDCSSIPYGIAPISTVRLLISERVFSPWWHLLMHGDSPYDRIHPFFVQTSFSITYTERVYLMPIVTLKTKLVTPQKTVVQTPESPPSSPSKDEALTKPIHRMPDVVKQRILGYLGGGDAFFSSALQAEIKANKQKDMNAVGEARTVINTLLRTGVKTEDAKGFPFINQAINAGNRALTNYLRKVGFPVGDSTQRQYWQQVFYTGLTSDIGLGGTVSREYPMRVPGMNVNAPLDRQGNTALALAVRNEKIDYFNTLLGVPGINPNLPNAKGQTPLHEAASKSNPAFLTKLLRAGADPNSVNMSGRNPVHKARKEHIEALKEAGADLDLVDKIGFAPLHYAANRHPDPELLTKLLEAGADPNQQVRREDDTFLQRLDPDAVAEIQAFDGFTPLHFVATQGNVGLAEQLLNAGADLTRKDATGRTPLDLARESEQDDMVALLEHHKKPFQHGDH